MVKQFGLAAQETGRVGDVLVATSNRANTNVEQLGQALKFAGPIANLASAELEETAAAIGILGDRGLQATLAGTGFRQSILRLVAPSKEAREVFEDLGLSLEEVDPTKVGLIQAFRALGDEQANLNQLSRIFGARTTAVASILARNADAVEELRGEIVEARGESEDFADALEDTLAGSFFAFRSALESVALSAGEDGLTGSLRSILDVGTEVARFFAGSTKAAAELSDTGERVVSALKGITLGFLAMKATQIILWVTRLVVAVRTLNVASLANPWLAAAQAIGAVTAAITFFITRVDQAAEAQKRLNELTQSAAKTRAEFDAALTRAVNEQDREAAVTALQGEISRVEQLLVRLDALQRESLGVDVIRPGEFDEFRQVALDLQEAGRLVRESRLEINVGADIDPQIGLIRESLTNLGNVIEGFPTANIEVISEDAEGELARLRQLLEFQKQKLGLDEESLNSRLREEAAKEKEAEAADKIIASLRQEIELLNLSAGQRAEAIEVLKAEQAAKEDSVIVLRKVNDGLRTESRLSEQDEDAIRALARTKFELTQAQKDQANSSDRVIQGLREELVAIQLTAFEARRFLALRQAGAEADLTPGQIDEIEGLVAALETAESLNRVARDIAQSFTDAFSEIATEADNLRDVLENLIQSISEALVNEFISRPFADFLATGFQDLFGRKEPEEELLSEARGGTQLLTEGASQAAALPTPEELVPTGPLIAPGSTPGSRTPLGPELTNVGDLLIDGSEALASAGQDLVGDLGTALNDLTTGVADFAGSFASQIEGFSESLTSGAAEVLSQSTASSSLLSESLVGGASAITSAAAPLQAAANGLSSAAAELVAAAAALAASNALGGVNNIPTTDLVPPADTTGVGSFPTSSPLSPGRRFGGLINKPSLLLEPDGSVREVAEQGPEAIVPLDASRERAAQLLPGFFPPEASTDVPSTQRDTRLPGAFQRPQSQLASGDSSGSIRLAERGLFLNDVNGENSQRQLGEQLASSQQVIRDTLPQALAPLASSPQEILAQREVEERLPQAIESLVEQRAIQPIEPAQPLEPEVFETQRNLEEREIVPFRSQFANDIKSPALQLAEAGLFRQDLQQPRPTQVEQQRGREIRITNNLNVRALDASSFGKRQQNILEDMNRRARRGAGDF